MSESGIFKYEKLLTAACRELVECGWLRQFELLGDGNVSATERLSWNTVARELSERLGGMFHVQHNGVRWQMGRLNFYIVQHEGREELDRVRQLVRNFTGLEAGYSYGSCASKLLSWSLIKCKPRPSTLDAFRDERIGFRMHTAGQYSFGAHYDAKACYFQLIKRLESPRLSVDKRGRIEFHPLLADENQKWREVISLVEGEKLLRNSMWGTMLGSSTKKFYFFQGEEKLGGAYLGSHWAAASLVGRTAYELTRQVAIETEAVYAHTDGVIVSRETKPELWDKYGIEYRLDAYGDTHILHTWNWKCGDKCTKHYDRRGRPAQDIPIAPAPEIIFYPKWL